MDKFAKMALEEYNSEENLIRPGGVNKNAFWKRHIFSKIRKVFPEIIISN